MSDYQEADSEVAKINNAQQKEREESKERERPKSKVSSAALIIER